MEMIVVSGIPPFHSLQTPIFRFHRSHQRKAFFFLLFFWYFLKLLTRSYLSPIFQILLVMVVVNIPPSTRTPNNSNNYRLWIKTVTIIKLFLFLHWMLGTFMLEIPVFRKNNHQCHRRVRGGGSHLQHDLRCWKGEDWLWWGRDSGG